MKMLILPPPPKKNPAYSHGYMFTYFPQGTRMETFIKQLISLVLAWGGLKQTDVKFGLCSICLKIESPTGCQAWQARGFDNFYFLKGRGIWVYHPPTLVLNIGLCFDILKIDIQDFWASFFYSITVCTIKYIRNYGITFWINLKYTGSSVIQYIFNRLFPKNYC